MPEPTITAMVVSSVFVHVGRTIIDRRLKRKAAAKTTTTTSRPTVVVPQSQPSEILVISRIRSTVESDELPEIVGFASDVIEAQDELHKLSEFSALEMRTWIERWEHENQLEALDHEDICAVLKMATHDNYSVMRYAVRTPVRESVLAILAGKPAQPSLLDDFLARKAATVNVPG